jgi:hypothetical protein
MADYHYVSTWQLQAPIEQVWTAITDLELAPGDAQGVGTRIRYVIKGRLPLRLASEATVTRVIEPRELELRAEGDLTGTGRWSLEQHDGITTARYTWDVHTTRPWMNLVAPLARPLFTWNSKGVMLQAGEGLARFLKVPLLRAEFNAPPWPGRRPLRWAVLATLMLWLLGRRMRSSRRS